jgi:hypothetical protein
LSAAALNEQLDAEIIFIQQIDERVDRSIKAAVTDPTTINMELPVIATRANKLLAFDADGDVTVSTETVSQIEGAATSATAADASATAAAASAAAAAASETAAGVSETNAAASAAAAAAAADDIIFNDVVYITNAASPYTLLTTQSGVLLAIDTSGGAVTVNLPSIASAGDGWRISAKKTTGDANFVTFARNGTDTIDGNTSDTITTVGQSKTYVADTDGTPDDWTSVNFGSTLGRTWTHFTYTASGGETSVTGADDDGVVLAYQAGQVKVYLEGLLLDDSDYTATNGTSITGLAALLVGQTLYIEAWDNVMSLGTMAAQDANAVAITGGTLASITSINAVTPATAQYTTALDTKLGGIEALADVTDATNVTAAGALMDSELTSIASVKALNQGVATTDTPTFAGIITSGNVDGRDVSVDGTKLDGIEAAADVTDATNVTAAGALMDSELTDIAAVKALDQGVATTDSPTFVNVTATDLDGILGSNTPAAATVTTLTASGNLTFTGSNPKISGGDTDGYLALAGNTLFSGAAVQLYGSTHATTPFDIVFLNSGTPHSRYDYSATAWDFGTNALTTTGTLSAGATDVTTLTASGDAVVDNLGTGGISPVRDLHVSNAGTNVFAQWTNNTTGHTTTDGWLSGMPNGTDFRYYGYEVGGVFTVYPEETLSLTVAKLGVTVAGTLSAGATTVTTLTATASGSSFLSTATVHGTSDPLLLVENTSQTIRGFVQANTTSSDFRVGSLSNIPLAFMVGNIEKWKITTAGTLDGNANALTTTGTLSAGATTVSTGASGATADAVADEGVFEGSGHSGISILTPSANYGSLHFRNPTDGLGALINHISGTGMTLATAVVGQTMVLRADNGVDNLTLSGASGSETAIFAGTADITNGVYIGGSAAANLLDDYEEGTFTPTLTGASTPGTGQAYTTQQGNYTKIGNVVNFNINLDLSSVGTAAGTLQIEGLPFTAANTAGSQQAAVIGNLDHINLTAGKTWAAPLIIDNAAYLIILEHGDAAAGAGITVSQFGGSLAITISGSYIAA